MFPPLTDFTALLGINLALCAGVLRLACRFRPELARSWRWVLSGLCFALLWLPAGAAGLPLVAYVRGVSSDLSMTLVVLSVVCLARHLTGRAIGNVSEKAQEIRALKISIALSALVLYPTALGLGDWDAYRLGWTPWLMWATLLVMALASLYAGWRLLALLIGVAMLGWAWGWMESSNLWDHLIDPWLAAWALYSCAAALGRTFICRNRGAAAS